MADTVPPINPTPGLPAVTERVAVPASAMFSESELTLPGATAETKPVAAAAAAPAPEVKAGEAAPAAPAPEVKAGEAAPAAPAPEVKAAADEKIKIGDKEYTKSELEAKLAERSAPAAAAPAPAPAPEVKPPTPEEVAAQEVQWTADFIKNENIAVPFTADEVETLLSGGEDAGKLLNAKLSDVIAKTVMLARKGIYSDLNPVMAQYRDAIQPLLVNSQQVEAAAAEQQFFTAYPEFKDHADTVRQVGEALLTRYPEQMSKLTREQQLAEVAAQADRVIQQEYKRWNQTGTSWKDVRPAPAATGVTAPAAPAAAAAPAPGAAPAAPAAAVVKPPGSNSPSGTAIGGGEDKSWHKTVAADLANG